MDKMQENNYNDEVEIDIKELFIILLDRMWIIVGVALVTAILAGIFTKLFIPPKYSSTTKLYLINRQSDSDTVTYSDLMSGNSLTQDCVVQITGDTVMSGVIEDLKLDLTEEELAGQIEVTNPENTRFVVITVSDTDPVVAQQIAKSVAKISAKVVEDILGVEKVNVAEEANLPTEKSSPNTKKNIVIGGVAGALLSIVIIVLLHLLNDTIRTPDDVKKYLGLNTLGQIPVLETETDKHKKMKHRKIDVEEEDAESIAVWDPTKADMSNVIPSGDDLKKTCSPQDEAAATANTSNNK